MATPLSYSCGTSTVPLIGRTIGELLDLITTRLPKNEAIISPFENKRINYYEFNNEVNYCARALMAIGVNKGDRVGIWSTNCTNWIIVQFATAKIGAILVNINPAYRMNEVEYALQQSECNYLIAGTEFKDVKYADMLMSLIALLPNELRFPHLRQIIFFERNGGCGTNGWEAWTDFLNMAERVSEEDLAAREADIDFDEVINIQYTSGTTGFPKGAMLTHRNILNNGFFVAERMKLKPGDKLCIPVPFYHCFGMVLGNLACVSHGATMVLPSPHFSPILTMETVQRERCTAVHGVPTMFIAMLEHPRFREFNFSFLRTGIMAGAPCPVEVMKKVIDEMHCREITIACGMTEASPVCNMTEVDDPIDLRVGTIGKVMPHQEQKIIDPHTGRIVPRGVAGEICYRGYNIMKGYYHATENSGVRIDENGWLHSGDIALMDENGYVRMTGRVKDMIARGGEKIFPREVEEFLYTNTKITEAHVIGVPDTYYGEQVMAWIKVKEGEQLTEQEVKDFCYGKIMDYKIPHYVKFVTEFPTTVTGKVQKFRMREISIEELGLKDEAGMSRKTLFIPNPQG